jgi:hypothetical protein
MSYPGGPGNHQQPPQPYHQPYGQPYQGFPPPKKSRAGLWLGLGALVLVIAVGTTLFFVLRDDRQQPQAAPAPTSAPPAPSTPRDSAPQPENNSNQVPAVTPGWQGLVSTRDKVAYDLPPQGWSTTPGTEDGFDTGPAKIVLHDASLYKLGACPQLEGSIRGRAGFVTAGQIDVGNAARGAVRLWQQASTAGADGKAPDVPQPPTAPLSLAGGAIQATTATATFKPGPGEECGPPSIKVTSVAFKVGEQTVCFLLALDQETPDTLPEADAQKILASLRPAQS